jgi:NAD+ diphosphatase
MAEIRITFAGLELDRCVTLRADAENLRRRLADPATRFLPVWRERCLTRGARIGLVGPERIAGFASEAADLVLLGQDGNGLVFALRIAGDDPPDIEPGCRFSSLRELMNELPAADAGLAAYARAMLAWQERHAFCGVCGSPNNPQEAGFVMACSSPACGHRSFPRLDPAVIVLVHRDERCLLGRQPRWPEGRFSTIAGFVEPGESLEDAVRREVREETNIRTGTCRYLASQPWPFPSALMIGFHAEALSAEIRLNDAELAEAGWFTREQIAARELVLPPETSVAYRLIEAWFDEWSGPSLDSLGLAGPPLRVRPSADQS